MEGLVSPSGSLKQISSRRASSSSSQKDLWFVTSQGTLSELETALLLLKKNGGSIDSRNTFGLTPLHLATWRNHVPIVKRLLAAGADPDARDGESGWSSLHRALHFGHLAVASILLQSGASLMLEDSKIRTPIDLLSGPVLQVNGSDLDSVTTEVFSWGSGANYQLGTGNAHIQKLPCKVDALQGLCVKVISAAKFHSVAIGAGGELYTWGFGRGGRLGHPDFDIHSGQAAVITPRQVTLGLGSRRVKAVAAAKHHTVIATESGEVFTWGSNREGQLGYTSVDTQPTPRRVSSLRSKIIAVAAANKHTAAVSESGEVFTWGCNKEGQLGYGTSNSASNYTPRVVEYLKGKVFTSVSAAKYHTIVLGADGEVFTWGHRLVTPRRVVVARNIKKYGAPLKFHRMERLHVVSIAAGMIHSTALTDDGALFYWISSDPDLRCQQLYSLCGRNIVSTSAGKYWTAAVTVTGDVYMCDGKKYKDETPIPSRLHGIKRATSVSVGETHVLVVCALYSPIYPPKSEETSQKQMFKDGDELEELDEDFMFNDMLSDRKQPTLQNDDSGKRSIPSLKSICERVAADYLVEPRNAIQLLEIADSLEADDLRKHCEEVSLRNLDYIFTVSAPAVASASLEILAKLEKSLDARSSESWSYRRLPTSTATFPAVINDELEGTENKGCHRLRDNRVKPIMADYEDIRADCFLQTNNAAEQAISKQIRALRKKLQQIEILELKLSNGQSLDDQQLEKLQSRSALETTLAGLGFPLDTEPKHPLVLSDGKGIKKMETCRKQRRKSKQNETLVETLSAKYEVCIPQNALKGFNDAESLQDPEEKGDVDINEAGKTNTNQCSFDIPKDALNSNNSKTPRSTLSKKKNKKGGLSMFLSGALDDNQKDAPLPPPPKSEGPVWGGAIILKGPASLRDIQNEQSKTKSNLLNRGMMDQSEDLEETGSVGYIRLSSFLPGVVSSPITVVPARAVAPPEGEKSTPPWSSSGTSPVMIRTSLRDIQIQQEKKHQGIISHSPKTSTSGFVVSSSSSQGSQLESGRPKDTIPSRWFKPETDAPSSIRSIQIEEKAMKDLKRFYSTVKLVRTQPQVP